VLNCRWSASAAAEIGVYPPSRSVCIWALNTGGGVIIVRA
jgi:hypothetical protein